MPILLGVQPRSSGVVVDPDLGVVQLAECINRSRIRRAHVAGGDDAQARAIGMRGGGEPLQVAQYEPEAAPFDERAEHIHAIC